MIDLCKVFGVEEGEEFKIELKDGLIDNLKYRVKDNCLEWCEKEIEVESRYYYAGFGLNDVNDITNIIKLPKKKEFTDDELCILRNINKKYKWIAKDDNGEIYVFRGKPKNYYGVWNNDDSTCKKIGLFNHIFNSLKWEDNEEPAFIDDYVERGAE